MPPSFNPNVGDIVYLSPFPPIYRYNVGDIVYFNDVGFKNHDYTCESRVTQKNKNSIVIVVTKSMPDGTIVTYGRTIYNNKQILPKEIYDFICRWHSVK